MLITHEHPPYHVCEGLGAALQWLTFTQWAVVLFHAISRCALIVFDYRVNTGRYDWGLLAGTYGIPLTMSVITGALRMHGPSGAW